MKKTKSGRVYFIGSGPGDPELLTLKAKRLIEKADVIIYAGSLVDPRILDFKKREAVSLDSSSMTLKEIITIISKEVKRDKLVVRIHSGDPSVYGALHEQIGELDKKGIPFEIIPGVSSIFAAAASLKRELTVPDLSQTLILTRISGRTKVPSRESIAQLAQSQSTMAIFLSVPHIEKVVQQLMTSYSPDTPVAVVHKASWPDEQIVRGTLATIAEKVRSAGIKRQALILVGKVLDSGISGLRSKLYHEGFTHGFRKASNKKGGCAIITLTKSGAELGMQLKNRLSHACLYVPEKLGIKRKGCSSFAMDLRTLCGELFNHYESLIFIMATGIVVRTLSTFLTHKSSDPAVVVVDEKGRFAVSLISGHLGGANELARRVASITDGTPVVTTATDVQGIVALDLLAQRLECHKIDFNGLKRCTYALLQGEKVGIYPNLMRPYLSMGGKGNLVFYKTVKDLLNSDCRYKIIVSPKRVEKGLAENIEKDGVIVLHPRNLVVGIGCNRGTSSTEIENTVKSFFNKWGLSFHSIKKVATVDLKSCEKGLISFARTHNFAIDFFTPPQLNGVSCPTPPSKHSLKAIGSTGVCEPAALLGAGVKTLLYPKAKTPNVTIAVAEIPLERFFRGEGSGSK
jgi:precorrin-4 C11-methyltransferase